MTLLFLPRSKAGNQDPGEFYLELGQDLHFRVGSLGSFLKGQHKSVQNNTSGREVPANGKAQLGQPVNEQLNDTSLGFFSSMTYIISCLLPTLM